MGYPSLINGVLGIGSIAFLFYLLLGLGGTIAILSIVPDYLVVLIVFVLVLYLFKKKK